MNSKTIWKMNLKRFGIELTNFYCVSIAPRREEYEKLQQYKEELALGSNFLPAKANA